MLTTELDLALRLYPVLQVVAESSQVDLTAVEELSHTLLAMPFNVAEKRGGQSGLNDNGSPLQVCLTSTAEGVQSRLLGDPAYVFGDPYVRYRSSRSTLDTVLALTDSMSIQSLCDRTLDFYVPKHEAEFSRFDSGVLWLGAGIQHPGCAMYVDARQADDLDAAWTVAQAWLSHILPHHHDATATIEALRPIGQLLSIGIEGSNLSNVRAKLYWRFVRPVRLDQIQIDLLHDPVLTSFLIRVIGDRSLHLSGLVPSAGFRVATGELFDTKIDVCGHCLAYDAATWIDLIDACTEAFELAPLPVAEALSKSQISYLGLGRDRQQKTRLNLYLKAAL